jgi:hypothetical protein
MGYKCLTRKYCKEQNGGADHPVFENRNEPLKEYSASFQFSNMGLSHCQME